MEKILKQENIQGYKVEYYKGTGKHKYKAVVYMRQPSDASTWKKVGTYQFGHIDYKNGVNSIEPGKYEWPTHKENMEHRKLYRQRHDKEKNTFPSAGWFSYHRLW